MRPTITHDGLAAARLVRLRHQERLSRREAAEFRLVGAERAYRHWAQRAARLRHRIEQAEDRER